MKLITEPKIYLVGRQAVDEPELSRFLADHGLEGWTTDAPSAGEKLAEVASRGCYQSFKNPRPGGNKAHLDHIKEARHGSIAEHATYSFIIAGVSRALTHELIRHRVGMSYSQLSQRYVDESDCAFVVPPALKKIVEDTNDPDLAFKWEEVMRRLREAYAYLCKRLASDMPYVPDMTATERRKAAREAARSVLPNATETKIFVTMNGRSDRHFFDLRASQHADAEIRRLAVAMLRVLQKESPNLFGDYEILPCPTGGEMAETQYRGV